jgi:uncharacterized protein YbjT (DUF2867 family)
MTVLVTGGTGHLGAVLVPLLVEHGHEVRVLTRDVERARRRLGETAEVVRGDARDAATLSAALDGVERVVSAMTGFGPDGAGPRAVDDEGTRNLIRLAETAGVGRFVLLSMRGAAAAHVMELARMKHAAEEALRASRLEWVIVRPTALMELWTQILGDPIRRGGKATVFGSGDKPVNLVSAGDVARVVEMAICEPHLARTVLEIGGPENLSLNEIVHRFQVATGRRTPVRHIPLGLMKLSRLVLQPFKSNLAGMIEAGISFETADMTFDATELRHRFPEMRLTSLADVIG